MNEFRIKLSDRSNEGIEKIDGSSSSRILLSKSMIEKLCSYGNWIGGM